MKAFSPRLPYLDTARGLAAISVIVSHCLSAVIEHPQATGLFKSPLHFFLYGEADMIFFFIHSGFILSYAHADFENEITRFSYAKYIISRIFRLYPLFLFILFLSYLLKSTIYPLPAQNYLSTNFLKFWSGPVPFSEVLKQGLMFLKTPESIQRLVPQDWTLTIEVLICPLIPFLNFLNRRLRLFSWLVILMLLKVFHYNTYLFEFAAGVGLFTYREQIKKIWEKINRVIKIALLLAAITFFTGLFGYPNIFDSNSVVVNPMADRLMVDAGCCLFFIFILNTGSIQKIFSHPVLVRVGKICYSLYVTHILLLICFSNSVMVFLHRFIKGADWFLMILFVLFFLFLTIFISLITYRFIEKPFNKWGKIFGNYLVELRTKSVFSKNE